MSTASTAGVTPAVFTLAELAAYLHRSHASLYRDIDLGKVPRSIPIGGRQMWLRAEIDEWLQAGAPPRDEWEARRAARPKKRR